MPSDARLKPARLNDLRLADEQKNLLNEIVRRGRPKSAKSERPSKRSGSTAILFAGPKGTGKTLAAHAIANELGLDFHHIDLREVVSKFIGETEKNLRRVFEKARAAGAILFFDEADALFGKRTEVRDSHDRFANIEVSYLLERMEEFEGLSILATNLKKKIDEPFQRRFRFVVRFP